MFAKMWMSAGSPECVYTAAVSIWTAPTNAPVTMVTKSPQTAKPAKMSTSVQLVTCALRESASTLQVHSLARTAGLGLARQLMDSDVKI